jgi:hypothetical protein
VEAGEGEKKNGSSHGSGLLRNGIVAGYDLIWGRIAERIRTTESMGILYQGKALWENTLWLERFPQEVLFRLKAILQDNGTRVSSPLAREGRGKG